MIQNYIFSPFADRDMVASNTVSASLATSVSTGTAAASPSPKDTIDRLVGTVFAVSTDAIDQPTRGRAPIALARQVAMYLAHIGTSLSLSETARLYHRDRTTVAHACSLVEDRRDDPHFDRALDLLERAVVRCWADQHLAR